MSAGFNLGESVDMTVHLSQSPDAVHSDDVGRIRTLTQEEYDALDPPDARTLYLIVSEKG